MTSATDVLRRMLDEREVEHYDGTERTLWGYEQTGEDTGIYRFAASEISGGFLQFDMFRITPEQAIAATLGTGTCKPREVRSRFSKTQEYVTYHCECGHELGGYMTAELPFPHTYNEDKLPNYCPDCGRRIVQ